MKGRSLRAAIDAHCRECGACDAGANWREHVSCCVALSCNLWPVRPLSRSVPDWLASRKRDHLPDGWCRLPIEAALTELRKAPSSALHDAGKVSRKPKVYEKRGRGRGQANAATCAPVTLTNGGAP